MALLARAARPAARTLFGWATLSGAALLAAVLSHWLIDVAGDYLLSHDTYDHIDHHSRLIAVSAACALALAGTVLVVRAALRDARRFRGALSAVLGGAAQRWAPRSIAVLVPLAFALLAGMESIDAWIAAGRLPTLTEALGGSLLLGSAVSVSTSVVVASCLSYLLRRLAASERSIARAIERIAVLRIVPAAPSPQVLTVCTAVARTSSTIVARRRGKRAPPVFAS